VPQASGTFPISLRVADATLPNAKVATSSCRSSLPAPQCLRPPRSACPTGPPSPPFTGPRLTAGRGPASERPDPQRRHRNDLRNPCPRRHFAAVI
jgi:hypothetical protein